MCFVCSFPTALFSEFFWSRTAFIFYTASFGAVALTKLWVWPMPQAGDVYWRQMLTKLPSSELAGARWRFRWPVLAIALSFISILIAPFGFALIPLIARLLDPTRGSVNRSLNQRRDSGLTTFSCGRR